jgi:hypothetical protein
MASNINPNNIDGTYPVAGQDNNSQGFRDNFTNTKTNFQYAENEINDLQTNAILKSALSGTVLDNNMEGSLLYNAEFNDIGYTRLAFPPTGGSVTIDYSLGTYQTLTTNASISLSFTEFPPAGVFSTVYVEVTIASTAHTLTLPSAVSVNNLGIQGLNSSTNVISFAATGTYIFQFSTSNGGSTITVNEVNKRLEPFNNSSEDLASTAGANLAVSTSYFSTTGPETATLAAGVSGQVKTFAMFANGGDMVITVANPGWGGGGTITFNAVGQTATLQYINGKWFVIGTGPATGGTFPTFA